MRFFIFKLLSIVIGCWAGFITFLLFKSLRKRSVTYFQDDNGKFRPWGDARYKIHEDKYFLIDYYQPLNRFQGYSNIINGLAWIHLKEDPEEEFTSDNLEKAGYIDLEGNVYDTKSKLVGYTCDEKGNRTIDGDRKWYELWLRSHLYVYYASGDLAGKVIETGRFGKLHPGRYSSNARAAAYMLLYGGPSERKINEDDLIYDGGWSDTALTASFLFSIVYAIFFLGNLVPLTFPAFGEQISFVVVMLLIYWLIWALVRQVKIEKTLQGVNVRHFLLLINRNTAVVGLTKTTILCTVIAIVLSVFVYGSSFLPLHIAVLIGLLVNLMSVTSEPWAVSESFPAPVKWDDDEEEEEEEEEEDDDDEEEEEEDGKVPDNSMEINYRWELDSDYHKLKGEMGLVFNLDELGELREKNPFKTYEKGFLKTVRNLFSIWNSLPKNKLHKILSYINHQASTADLSDLEKMQFILDFVQSPNIAYQFDNACEEIGCKKEYVRFPDETLFDKRGDCDCKAALAAALFVEAGYKTVLLTTMNHCAVGVAFPTAVPPELQMLYDDDEQCIRKDNLLYFFCETTADRFRIGDCGSTLLSDVVDKLFLN